MRILIILTQYKTKFIKITMKYKWNINTWSYVMTFFIINENKELMNTPDDERVQITHEWKLEKRKIQKWRKSRNFWLHGGSSIHQPVFKSSAFFWLHTILSVEIKSRNCYYQKTFTQSADPHIKNIGIERRQREKLIIWLKKKTNICVSD